MEISRINKFVWILLPVLLFMILLTGYITKTSVILPLVVFVILSALLVVAEFMHRKEKKKKIVRLSDIISKDVDDALTYGEMGLVICDEKFEISWMNDFFLDQGINFIGEKITKWIPEITHIFENRQDELIFEYQNRVYRISRKPDSFMLFFIDVTDSYHLQTAYDNEKVVLGLLHMDNYDEATQYEDETDISIMDSEIRQTVVKWALSYRMLVKKIKNDRYLLILNEDIYKEIVAEEFNILDVIRTMSADYPVPITLSMAFARGSTNYAVLDEMLNSLLALAQSRGGDQVVSRRYGEDVEYYGGKTEAQEKSSKTRVRVLSQSLGRLIQQSDKVIIIGHKTMDFDCMGAALGLSRIVQSYNKVACIVYDDNDTEAKLKEALQKYSDHLIERNYIVTKETAMDQLEENSLVVLVDHNDLSQDMAPEIVKAASKIAVLDHHRRKGDFEFVPLLAYIEAGASSVTEMISEFFLYQSYPLDVSETEALIMFTGILVDTTNFRNRTGTRTFEAASVLRRYGADPMQAQELLKEDFDVFELKAAILKYCEKYDNGVVIVPYQGEKPATRSIISQVANELLDVGTVEASFVFGKVDDCICGSARSNGKINVQVIFEQLGGGGHFTQAGLQRNDISMDELKRNTLMVLDQYFTDKEE